jgi:ABC-type bacteriocin/lantibiotic exporter with double-glycine peptidase domain
MQTLVTEGGGTLSGGQKQRLMIAASIVNKPRIIFFDEATSALDNRTQQIVSDSLENMDATRIVIAHRLSTVIHADKIIVMDNGKVVQVGTYASLINEDGPFAKMAQRQMV